MSLKKARDVLERLVSRELVPVELEASNPTPLHLDLAKLGVSAAVREPRELSVKQVRERQRLSQADFARLYGFEVDTVQNWEQGRYNVDRAAKILLNVIDYDPAAVISAIFKGLTLDEHDKWTFVREFEWNIDHEINGTVRPPAPEGFMWVLRPKHSDVR